MKKVLSKCKAILLVLLSLILLANLYMLFQRLVLKEELPSIFGIKQAVVVSGSMEPIFSAGDMVVFTEQQEYQVNDIVIFSQAGNFVTHRIIEETENGFVTKGDANNTQDSEILNPDSIHGKMIFSIPFVGFVTNFFGSPFGILILIVIGLGIFELAKVFENRSKRGSENA